MRRDAKSIAGLSCNTIVMQECIVVRGGRPCTIDESCRSDAYRSSQPPLPSLVYHPAWQCPTKYPPSGTHSRYSLRCWLLRLRRQLGLISTSPSPPITPKTSPKPASSPSPTSHIFEAQRRRHIGITLRCKFRIVLHDPRLRVAVIYNCETLPIRHCPRASYTSPPPTNEWVSGRIKVQPAAVVVR